MGKRVGVKWAMHEMKKMAGTEVLEQYGVQSNLGGLLLMLT